MLDPGGNAIGVQSEAGGVGETIGARARPQRIKMEESIVKRFHGVLGTGKQSQGAAGFGASIPPCGGKSRFVFSEKAGTAYEDATQRAKATIHGPIRLKEKGIGRGRAEPDPEKDSKDRRAMRSSVPDLALTQLLDGTIGRSLETKPSNGTLSGRNRAGRKADQKERSGRDDDDEASHREQVEQIETAERAGVER